MNTPRKLIALVAAVSLSSGLCISAFAEDKTNEKTKASFYFNSELSKITPGFCPECKVKVKAVPIVYGLPDPKSSLTDRANRGEIVLGGCNVYDGQPNTALICPKCKKVFSEYLIDEKLNISTTTSQPFYSIGSKDDKGEMR